MKGAVTLYDVVVVDQHGTEKIRRPLLRRDEAVDYRDGINSLSRISRLRATLQPVRLARLASNSNGKV
jgi:hypothetical protein